MIDPSEPGWKGTCSSLLRISAWSPKVQCSLFEGTHLGLEQCAAVIGRSKEEPAEAGPDHEEERRPPTRPRGQHRDG